MIVQGQYFTINRARQYGKTTTLRALENYLEPEYLVVSIDFQMLSSADFENEKSFVEAFGREISDALSRKKNIGENVPEKFTHISRSSVGKCNAKHIISHAERMVRTVRQTGCTDDR
jgi:hypothetical protein